MSSSSGLAESFGLLELFLQKTNLSVKVGKVVHREGLLSMELMEFGLCMADGCFRGVGRASMCPACGAWLDYSLEFVTLCDGHVCKEAKCLRKHMPVARCPPNFRGLLDVLDSLLTTVSGHVSAQQSRRMMHCRQRFS